MYISAYNGDSLSRDFLLSLLIIMATSASEVTLLTLQVCRGHHMQMKLCNIQIEVTLKYFNYMMMVFQMESWTAILNH